MNMSKRFYPCACRHSPDSGYPHFSTLRVLDQTLKDSEEILDVGLEPLDDILQYSEQYVDADLTMCDAR